MLLTAVSLKVRYKCQAIIKKKLLGKLFCYKKLTIICCLCSSTNTPNAWNIFISAAQLMA